MVRPPGADARQTEASLSGELSDACLVARMRLVLALAVLLALQIEPSGLQGMGAARWPVLTAYGLYSLAIEVGAQRRLRWALGTLPHWLDVLWYGGLVALTGGVGGIAYLFFFPIVTASLRWGRQEGGWVTLASTLACLLGTVLAEVPTDATRLLLRTCFLLGLGQLCVHWGQAQVQLKRRLALLRDVSQLSNPRFGVEHTLHQLLEGTRAFFGASNCLLVLREQDSGAVSLHWSHAQGPHSNAPSPALSSDLASLLLPFDTAELMLHRPHRPHRLRRPGQAGTQCLPPGQERWGAASPAQDTAACALAAMLEARSFISVPVALRQGGGRLYVCREDHHLSHDDALFLKQLVAQAFPMLDHIDLLDRMATEAATRERQKFALDLHDTAVQPYLGLRLALGALRQQARPGNPLVPGLEKLEAMAARVAEDLRRYARQVQRSPGGPNAFIAELHQQAAQVREFYGVDIDVHIEGDIRVGDRLSAEVLQVVREGLSNICKHTLAQRGELQLQCRGGWLGIRIANEGDPHAGAADFTPRSLSERAAALGGRAHVLHDPRGGTAVHIHIPV